MHFFDSVRRYSRNGGTASSKKSAQTAQTPVPPSPVISATTRQPLVPQTNLTLKSSQSSLASQTPSNGSSGQNSSQKLGRNSNEDNVSKATQSKTTRIERSNTVGSAHDGNPWAMPAKTLASSQRSTYTHHPDLYTHNALNSFSFGAASSTPFQAKSIDPLSTGRDDDSDDYPYKADTTPRPSLVASSSPRSHSSQLPQMSDYVSPASLPPPPRPRPSPERARRTSNASTHTFGTSSASASATSLSSAAMGSSTGSQRGGSTTTPQTSANELTSEDDDEEHRHPIPACPPSPFLHQNDSMSLYASDYDEFDDDLDLDREDFEPDIEISSVIHDEGEQGSLFDFHTPSPETSHSLFPPRKGSLAVPIPSPNSTGESIATRRPSRSLENLRSDSRADTHSVNSRHGDVVRNSLSPTPISLPGSEGDWREVRRRSVQKEKERELANRTVPSLTLTPSPSNVGFIHQDPTASSSTAIHNPVPEGFDNTWNIDPITGIVNLEMDQLELADIVGNYQGPRSADRSFHRASSSTTDSGRRLSTTSTNSDPFTKGLNKWLGQEYQDEKMKWTFVREKADRLEGRAALQRERNSVSNLFDHKPNYSQSSGFLGSSSGGFHEYSGFRESKILVKDSSKPKEAQPWKGMAIDAEEWWSSYSNGRYRVIRKSQQNAEPGKPPQQRLNISHHRTPYSVKRDLSDGPSITIHKHSKAIGFSISRHYRTRPVQMTSGGNPSGRASISSRITVAPAASAERKRSTNMILLAPRRVQEAFTSTTTTRMLQSHGLLSESGRQSPRDLERLEREKKERKKKEEEKERQRQKELKKAEAKGKDKGKSRSGRSGSGEQSNPTSSSESSAGSVVNSMRPPLNPGPSGPSHSSRTSVDHSVMSHGTASSSQTIIWSGLRRVSYDESYDIDPDDDYDVLLGIKRRPPRRTPHGEVFSTLPVEAFERYGKQEPSSYNIFGWNKPKSNTLIPRHLIESYNPPWAIAQARYNPDKKGIVEDLNSSFQDVGLLPAVDEVKSSSSVNKRKRQLAEAKHQNKSREEQPNVFHSFSSEYLYMLLPLWPGETDPQSAKKHPYPVPDIPVESRQYLLVFYKPDSVPSIGEPDKPKNQRDKKRGRNSPSSSRDLSHKQENRHILYDKFHFCARVVTYTDIQGSGIRSPDVGLSVLGPLSEACETMPTQSYIDTFQIIGLCNSRERGIEFLPEGLEKLGLARRVPDPTAPPVDQESVKRFSITGVDEPDDISDMMLVLTPIGRAVVEMAWLGAMALTSFGSTP